jgi:hypothetical protein
MARTLSRAAGAPMPSASPATPQKSARTFSKYQEHPVVVPHVMHFKHVPFRTMVNWPQSPQGSPS